MNEERKIFAEYNREGIYVYQAFDDEIANEAIQRNKFGKKFHLDRLSWIKPSFGWILYRSHYASKTAQNRILKILLSHEGFLSILENAIPTVQDMTLFLSGKEWRSKLNHSDVRYQWDPDRDYRLEKLSRRALQLGLRNKMLEDYAKKWLKKIEDVTPLAKKIHEISLSKTITRDKVSNLWPNEKEYIIPEKIKVTLGILEV